MTDVVFSTEHGCALRCGCCGHLHLLFGNALIVVDRGLFECFRSSLAGFDSDDAVVDTPLGRRAILRPAASASSNARAMGYAVV